MTAKQQAHNIGVAAFNLVQRDPRTRTTGAFSSLQIDGLDIAYIPPGAYHPKIKREEDRERFERHANSHHIEMWNLRPDRNPKVFNVAWEEGQDDVTVLTFRRGDWEQRLLTAANDGLPHLTVV